MKIDIVLDVCYGDSAKGKVTHHLLGKNHYDICLKSNGGGNAGHAIYYDGQKFTTHIIPIGIFHNVKCIIGVGCVLHVKSFLDELNSFQEKFQKIPSLKDIDLHSLVKIDKNTFIVEDKHLEEDSTENKVGSTRKGIAPAYRDKYGRNAKQAKDIPELKPYLTDLYEEIKDNSKNILVEGSQGFFLDCHFSDNYPYVTSSHCSVGGVLINGLPYKSINNVYACCKAYDTYVGNMKFQGDDPIFIKIAELGAERGETTGRLRQCNWLNVDKLIKSSFINSITHLVVSKMDILQQLNIWKVKFDNGEILDLKTENEFKIYLIDMAKRLPTNPEVLFSYSKDQI